MSERLRIALNIDHQIAPERLVADAQLAHRVSLAGDREPAPIARYVLGLPAVDGRFVDPRVRDDVGVKHSTAISRLGDVADGLDRAAPWPDCTVVAAHVVGPVLDTLDDVERVQLASVVNKPAETLAWLSHPARLEAMAALLRFDKLPLAWWRPAAWPVWNHHIARALRFLTVAGGRDQGALDALASGNIDPLRTDRPANREELVAQLVVERDVSRRHLVEVVSRFYDRGWRRQHSGGGVYPEEHLWWATSGYLELDDAITNTTS